MQEGGGNINGSLLAAGLIDELSLLVLPLADGTAGTPTNSYEPATRPQHGTNINCVAPEPPSG